MLSEKLLCACRALYRRAILPGKITEDCECFERLLSLLFEEKPKTWLRGATVADRMTQIS
jgi:hypothetical protein